MILREMLWVILRICMGTAHNNSAVSVILNWIIVCAGDFDVRYGKEMKKRYRRDVKEI